MKNTSKPITINSISELHRLAGIEKPLHPMISLIKFQDVVVPEDLMDTRAVLNLYSIFFKKNVRGKVKYGQNHYDFDEGVLGMNAPGQLMAVQDQYEAKGWWLIFHPDFVQGYPLASSIKKYGFFDYAVNEALHLSVREEILIETVFKNIEQEYNTAIDIHTQHVMISQMELLLNYSNRFYDRQFITRKNVSQTVVTRFESLLSAYFDGDQAETKGLPNVPYFSALLHVSPHYLSDILRKHTGQNTQQHIHQQLIEKAKEKLSTTDLSVNEIAFQLGFEHAQSFNKLFKSKTRLSPLEFRKSFN